MSFIPFLTNHWYYNTESGELTNGNNLQNLGNNLFGGLGWHELNIPGNASEAQATAEARKEFPHGKTPTTSITQGVVNTVPAAGNIDDVINWIKNNWESIGIRIGETMLGLILVYVGLKAITTPSGQAPVQRTAKDTAKTAAKMVIK